MALAVGKEAAINRIYGNMEVSPVRMSRMSASQRAKVRANLDLASAEITAWCFRVDRRNIEKAMRKRMKSGKKRKPEINAHKIFESYWFPLFKGDLANFAAKSRADLSDIVIAVDSDMRPALKAWKTRDGPHGRAHELSDAVAWLNQMGTEIRKLQGSGSAWPRKEDHGTSLAGMTRPRTIGTRHPRYGGRGSRRYIHGCLS